MKLNRNFAAIAFHQSKPFQKIFQETMMDKKVVDAIKKQFSENENVVEEREFVMKKIATTIPSSKLYYISKNVQDHADLIKFDRIKLSWFNNIKEQHSTYIVGKHEFFRFWVNEGKTIHIGHFFVDEDCPFTLKDFFAKQGVSQIPNDYKDFFDLPVMKWEVFVIRLENYPDGYMPVNPLEDNNNKEFFTKLLLFIELSEIEVVEVKPNQKIKINPVAGRNFDNKLKNESGIPVTLVSTNWNKIIIVGQNEFTVSGHFRFQPYGPSRSLEKLIWIDEFKKKPFIRRGRLNASVDSF